MKKRYVNRFFFFIMYRFLMISPFLQAFKVLLQKEESQSTADKEEKSTPKKPISNYFSNRCSPPSPKEGEKSKNSIVVPSPSSLTQSPSSS